MFSKAREDQQPQPVDKKALDFIKKTGFNAVRLPMDYRFWIKDHRYFDPEEEVLKVIDSYLEECFQRDLNVSLNLHRAPGYCVNRNELEIHNLWEDDKAQQAFKYQWAMFAERYKDISKDILSFDLLNEPPFPGKHGMTRENHEEVMRKTVDVIRKIDQERVIEIDGLGCGNIPMPELADLNVIQSARGYQPIAISHYKAGWVGVENYPEPEYPGLQWNKKTWNKNTLREVYQPWRELEEKGVEVFIGEFGCFNKIENQIALAWLEDLLSLFKEFKWGYLLWNFEGSFGIVDHGRPGTEYEKIDGYNVDKKLLDLLLENRVQ